MKLFGVDDASESTKWEENEQSISVEIWDDRNDIHDEELWQIALDVLENHESVYILAPVAWIELGDIDISVHETTLTISWTRNRPKEFHDSSIKIKNSECFWGRFLRNIILADNMDFSWVKAVMENNLLVIHVPKLRFDSQSIKINRITD